MGFVLGVTEICQPLFEFLHLALHQICDLPKLGRCCCQAGPGVATDVVELRLKITKNAEDAFEASEGALVSGINLVKLGCTC